jgi:hypothetical protein
MPAHHAAILVADLGGAQAVADLHDTTLVTMARTHEGTQAANTEPGG